MWLLCSCFCFCDLHSQTDCTDCEIVHIFYFFSSLYIELTYYIDLQTKTKLLARPSSVESLDACHVRYVICCSCTQRDKITR